MKVVNKKWIFDNLNSSINTNPNVSLTVKKIIEDINSRFPGLKSFQFSLKKYIYKIDFFESIVSFDINRKLCKKNSFIENNKKNIKPIEYRNFLNKRTILYKLKTFFKLKTNFTYPVFILNAFKLKKYFK